MIIAFRETEADDDFRHPTFLCRETEIKETWNREVMQDWLPTMKRKIGKGGASDGHV